MPIALADAGFSVHVVDPDTLKGRYHNEWESVDYQCWGITTHRAGMEDQVLDEQSLDLAVSVSVIEHLPAEARRAAITELARIVSPKGIFIITIDLLTDGIHLWNRVIDEIEPPLLHGTIDEMFLEFEAAGFKMVLREPCPIPTAGLKVEGIVYQRQ